MYIIVPIAIFVNIVAIIELLVGLFYNFVQPKNKAIFGYSVVGSMLAYVILLGLFVIRGWISNVDLYCFILTLCAISPFVIGKLVKYETLKKYTIIQIIFFIISLVILLLMLN